MTGDDVDRVARQIIRELRGAAAFQRDEIVTRILRDDPELAPVLPAILGLYESVKGRRRLGVTLRRDGVSG